MIDTEETKAGKQVWKPESEERRLKKRGMKFYAGLLLISGALCLGACGEAGQGNQETDGKNTETENQEAEHEMKAVYLKKGESPGLFVDTENDTLFSGTIPEDALYDEEGNRIQEEDLNNGDVVTILGNGIMAESYPGQYHGIYEIRRTEQKNQEYLEKYGHYLDERFQEPDPAEVPHLNLCYQQSEAIVTAAILETGGYTWTYEEENGESASVSVDAPHVLEWESYTEVETEEPLTIGFQFSKEPERIEVTRWTQAEHEKAVEERNAYTLAEGEAVEVIRDQEERSAVSAEPGYIYGVKAYWENGEADYGFAVVSREQ